MPDHEQKIKAIHEAVEQIESNDPQQTRRVAEILASTAGGLSWRRIKEFRKLVMLDRPQLPAKPDG